ncbi:MAG: winged helix-turn-helix transcriptional regulator [Methanomicrobiaceae archaeon]|nr:winged helix-turn-helix transcriptional regulator [Methanomicrobiaceae archaeon]
MISCIRFLIISFILYSVLVSGAGAEIIEEKSGYIVEPVTPGMDTGTPLETVPVEFWELPPDFILYIMFLSASSYLGFPVELILSVKMYMLLGFRKISQKSVLSNETRNTLYSCIRDNPGINFTDLMDSTGVNRGNIAYHLNLLKMTGKISVLESSGNPRYFENSGMYSGTEKAVLKYIKNDKDCQILRLILEKPNLTRKDLGEHIGLNPSTVSWRMRRLGDDEMILVRKDGRNVRYEINPEIHQHLEKYLSSGESVSGSKNDGKSPELV